MKNNPVPDCMTGPGRLLFFNLKRIVVKGDGRIQVSAFPAAITKSGIGHTCSYTGVAEKNQFFIHRKFAEFLADHVGGNVDSTSNGTACKFIRITYIHEDSIGRVILGHLFELGMRNSARCRFWLIGDLAQARPGLTGFP